MLVHVERAFRDSRETYGSPRVTVALNLDGVRCGRHYVARLMREAGLFARVRKRYKVTTNSEHSHRIAPNTLDRQFEQSKPNAAWASDITYIKTKEGWLYLAVGLDIYSRLVVGWAVRPTLATELVRDALVMALRRRKPTSPCLHHSDRGSQYATLYSDGVLRSYRLECSMSRKGNCWDNAVVESFFKTLKTECFRGTVPESRAQAASALLWYIEAFYNHARLHSSLGYLSPVQFERSRSP